MREDTRSLWEQYDSAVEPWRRGRAILVTIGFCYLISQALLAAGEIALGNIEQLLASSIGFTVFWLLFYFIWIGVHWVRWLVGAWNGITGFCWVIWGFGAGSVAMVSCGTIDLFVAAYFCLSPSVYFFAKRQREERNWTHSLSVAGAFVLMFVSLFMGGIGLSAYKAQLEAEGGRFADEAFRRIFTDHDIDFLLDRITEQGLSSSGGREELARFVQITALQTGQVHDIKRASARLKLFYSLPANFGCVGTVTAQGIGVAGPLQLRLNIIQADRDWQIETLEWHYPR